MKLLVLLFALLIPISSHAADDATQTRARTAAVERAAPKATIVKRDLQGYSLEGGQLTAYSQKGVPLKFVAKHFGESGRTTDEIYFWQGRLFFALSTRENYDMPIGASSTPVKVVSREQNRFYFKNGAMWRWIDESGKAVARGGAGFKSKEAENLSFTREMLAGARGKAKIIVALN